MLVAVVLVVPVLKLAWTLGGGDGAREALAAMGPGDWPDIVIGMFLAEPVLATVTAVVVSHVSYAVSAGTGGAKRHQGRPLASGAVMAALIPVSAGIIVGSFNGLIWGLVTGLLSYGTRLGVLLEYRTGLRAAETGKRTGRRATSGAQRWAAVSRVVALSLAWVVLPLVAVAGALDGRSWTSVLNCDVNTGTGAERVRVIELGRNGSGVIGWDLPSAEVVNGTDCAADPDDVIRRPWWNT